MPIRPEEPHHSLPEELFGKDTFAAMEALRAHTGHDVMLSADFWEQWISVQMAGERTPQKAAADIAVTIAGREYRAEVKYSRAFWAEFSPVHGSNVSRYVFKWLLSPSQHRERPADAVILIGVDAGRRVYAYVIPAERIKGRSITVTAPAARQGGKSKFDQWLVPPTELLPAFHMMCLRDAPMRRAGIQQRARAQRASGDLFQCTEVSP